MHIPNEMINGPLCPITAVMSIAGLSLAVLSAKKEKGNSSSLRFAAITAFIFAAQMINFPITNGTSGHFLGAALAVSLLGLPLGILAMALVATLQCIFFADGGLQVLGANILNMAIVAPSIAYCVLRPASQFKLSRLGIASALSIIGAALFCSLELAVSKTTSLTLMLPAMLGIHALIGIAEALLTCAAYLLLKNEKYSALLAGSSALFLAGIFSPFASAFPDGLEAVAHRFNFLSESPSLFPHPFVDYSVTFIANPILSTSIAGLIGISMTFLFSLSVGKGLLPQNK
jgi:cobalt/nickel transport system permease protein